MKDNKLLKITKITDKHNDLKYLEDIKKISNYDKYFTLPDDEIFTIKPNDMFYQYLIDLSKKRIC